MSKTDSASGKPSIFVTRRWPQAAEVALSQHFDVTLNEGDKPLSRDALGHVFVVTMSFVYVVHDESTIV